MVEVMKREISEVENEVDVRIDRAQVFDVDRRIASTERYI